jgi:hypothetical protein
MIAAKKIGASTIHCQEYRAHMTFHRLVHERWICLICSPAPTQPPQTKETR